MKRYEPTFSSRWYPTMQEGEADEGEWVLYRDVLKETIPRPDPEAARRALEDYTRAIIARIEATEYELVAVRIGLDAAEKELLRLMGVTG